MMSISIDPRQRWQVAEAKQRLSELVRQAEREPQWIYNRDRAVVAVVEPEEFARYQAWRAARHRSVASAFAELRAICQDEGYELQAPARVDRANTFLSEG